MFFVWVRRRIRVRSRIRMKRAEYLMHRESAKTRALELLAQCNQHYQLTFRRVTIKNLGTRWGSCSRLGNLNFHVRLIHLPQDLAEYLIVHELCHLKEMNHSRAFWDLVAQTIPDFADRRARLRNFPTKNSE